MNELVAFVRQADVERVRAILSSKETDVNAVCAVTARHVEPSGTPVAYDPTPSETPLYPSHALFEATRSGHVELMQVLLADPAIDANLTATAAGITTLADCAARGRWDLAKVLLDSGKVAHTIGSTKIGSPLLYAINYGHARVVAEFLARKLASNDEEAELKAAAAANGNSAVIQALRDYYLTEKPLSALSLDDKVDKIKLEFDRCDVNRNKIIDLKELLALSTVLGEPLTDDEAAEALVAMDTDHDNRVDVNEVIAFWLGERITEH